jgi:hypothetical protein
MVGEPQMPMSLCDSTFPRIQLSFVYRGRP